MHFIQTMLAVVPNVGEIWKPKNLKEYYGIVQG